MHLSLPWSLHRAVEFAFLISFKHKADNEPRCCCRFSPSRSLTAVSHCLWIWIIHGTLGPFREPRCQIIGSILLWFCPLPIAVRFIVNSPLEVQILAKESPSFIWLWIRFVFSPPAQAKPTHFPFLMLHLCSYKVAFSTDPYKKDWACQRLLASDSWTVYKKVTRNDHFFLPDPPSFQAVLFKKSEVYFTNPWPTKKQTFTTQKCLSRGG